MTPEEGGKADLPKDWERDLPSWRRIGEFIRNILRLERSVEALKKENRELEQRVGTLQRQVDEQAGQLRVLSDFVSKALDERVESRAEEASIRAFERMASIAGLKPGKRPRRKAEK
jgi:predicted RNase H-like nuclease (RuvC/YqgF family)